MGLDIEIDEVREDNLESVINNGRLARRLAVVIVLAGSLAVSATGALAQSAPNPPEKVFALTDNNRLLKFDGDNPEDVKKKKITGLLLGDSDLVGIDYRPANGLLYALSGSGNIYTIRPKTGAATFVSKLTVPLEGSFFGIDFNPVPDRLRVVSDTDQNLRINVDNGITTVDTDLQYAPGDQSAGTNPSVTGAAYTNNVPPSPRDPATFGTTLYDIDGANSALVTQNPPNAGTLNTVGKLGGPGTLASFDIVSSPTAGSTPTNRAFASLKPGKSSQFFAIDLGSGSASKIGRIGSKGTTVTGIAIPIGQQ